MMSPVLAARQVSVISVYYFRPSQYPLNADVFIPAGFTSNFEANKSRGVLSGSFHVSGIEMQSYTAN
jgi:hypothetical protein